MLRKILVIGAGKSTSYLLDYFSEKAKEQELQIIIADLNPDTIPEKFKTNPSFETIKLDIFKTEERQKIIEEVAIVVSMLPAHLHINIAKDCIQFRKHMVTASYVSDEIKLLDQEAKDKNLVFMNEIGLDPGIDHMSAIQIINRIKNSGGKMLLFESFTGGLVAPESDNNLLGILEMLLLRVKAELQSLFKKALINTFLTINYLEELSLLILIILENLKCMPIEIH